MTDRIGRIGRIGRRWNPSNAAVFLLPPLMVAIGHLAYRPPTALPVDAPESAGRARAVLEAFVGDPPVPHPAGSRPGRAAVERLGTMLRLRGMTPQRIVTDMPVGNGNGRAAAVPEGDRLDDGRLVNLVVTLPGSDAGLKPLVIATHHDSHPAAPGGGDSGIGVASLVESLRVMSLRPRRRTVHGLFTDGEEYGLLGAETLIRRGTLPFDEPAFVLNFDARGVRGPSLMYETSGIGSSASVNLLNDLARPRIATSLAVAVYERLDNATDFNVWRDAGWSGFNFAANEGADHYHRVTDTPANVDDATLQHTIDHMLSLQAAIDRHDEASFETIDNHPWVWFDLLGLVVIFYPAGWQMIFATASLATLMCRRTNAAAWRARFRGTLEFAATLVAMLVIGAVFRSAYQQGPWAAVRYTPIDRPIGLTSAGVGWVLTLMLLWRRPAASDIVGASAVAAAVAAWFAPATAYVLVLPVAAAALTQWVTTRNESARWAFWAVLTFLLGSLTSLLAVALGPLGLSIYPLVGGLVAVATPRPDRAARARLSSSLDDAKNDRSVEEPTTSSR